LKETELGALLENKVALITGGTSGIGRASVQRFLAAGARVVIADIADEDGLELARESDGQATYVHADVTVEADIEAAVAATVNRFGRLDIIYNNAGGIGDPASLLEIEQKGFDHVIGLDVRSVLWGHKYAARQFKAQGGGGCIISTASVASMQAGWSPLSYTAAKHAVLGIVRHAAMELASFGIRSNAVAPGAIPTPLVARAFGVSAERAAEFLAHVEEGLGGQQPMGRFGKADDIADVALFLASDLSRYVTGALIPVDGGATIQADNRLNGEVLTIAEMFRTNSR
jgi:NAD(P)-dependent dehydrogenase (short-subunit alcohol dehydrogenase family)